MKKLNKNILLGIGSIASIAAPIATVVACGSDDAKPATTPPSTAPATNPPSTPPATNPPSNEHKATTTSFTGAQFITETTKEKLGKFVVGSSTTPAGDIDVVKAAFEVEANFDITKYNELVNDSTIAFSAKAKEMFKEILQVNKNDPKLAANVIAFTFKTVTDISAAYMGLRPTPDGETDSATVSGHWQKDVDAAEREITGGSIDYKTIADGFMMKFGKQDPIWINPDKDAVSMTLQLYSATPEGPHATTLTEGMMAAILGNTMAGTKVVKAITEAAGYTYAEAAPASS